MLRILLKLNEKIKAYLKIQLLQSQVVAPVKLGNLLTVVVWHHLGLHVVCPALPPDVLAITGEDLVVGEGLAG